MNRYKRLILEVKKFPESQEVMDNPEWFFVCDDRHTESQIGDSAFARVMDESEYILVEKTTADEFNPKSDDCMISYQDPGDEND